MSKHHDVTTKPGSQTSSSRSRRGGEVTRDRHGVAFYARIGQQGGTTIREQRGSAFYAQIGQKGGQATRDARGSAFYAAIGRIGGKKGRRGASGASRPAPREAIPEQSATPPLIESVKKKEGKGCAANSSSMR